MCSRLFRTVSQSGPLDFNLTYYRCFCHFANLLYFYFGRGVEPKRWVVPSSGAAAYFKVNLVLVNQVRRLLFLLLLDRSRDRRFLGLFVLF